MFPFFHLGWTVFPNTFILKVSSGLVKLEGSVGGDVLYLPDLGVTEGSG